MKVPLRDLPPGVEEVLTARNAAQRNLYRALANSPEAVEAWLAFVWSLRDDLVTPRPTRELLILRIAVREASPYEWHHHVKMARASGVSEAKIEAAATAEAASSAVLGEADRLVVELADAVAAGSVSDELAALVTERFGERGYVELAVTASAYVMVARVLDALGVPLEADPPATA